MILVSIVSFLIESFLILKFMFKRNETNIPVFQKIKETQEK